MNRIQKIAVGAVLSASALTGGALGASLLNGSANAQTTTSTPAPGTAPVDNSNKDAAHEAAETPAHAADEAAGRAGGGGNHVSNKDAAHEAAESPARAAEEASRDAAIANGSSTTANTGSTATTSN